MGEKTYFVLATIFFGIISLFPILYQLGLVYSPNAILPISLPVITTWLWLFVILMEVMFVEKSSYMNLGIVVCLALGLGMVMRILHWEGGLELFRISGIVWAVLVWVRAIVEKNKNGYHFLLMFWASYELLDRMLFGRTHFHWFDNYDYYVALALTSVIFVFGLWNIFGKKS